MGGGGGGEGVFFLRQIEIYAQNLHFFFQLVLSRIVVCEDFVFKYQDVFKCKPVYYL